MTSSSKFFLFLTLTSMISMIVSDKKDKDKKPYVNPVALYPHERNCLLLDPKIKGSITSACNLTMMVGDKWVEYVRGCPANEYCIKEGNTAVYFCRPENSDFLNGHSCTENSLCRSGFCDNGVCAGRKEGDECTEHKNCDNSLYCSKETVEAEKGVCKKLLQENEKCNKTLDVCDYGLGCTTVKINATENFCVKYFSRDNKEYSEEEIYCRTGYMDDKTCKKTYAVYYEEVKPCNTNEDCPIFISGNLTKKGFCINSTVEIGKKYCHITTKNKEFTDFITMHDEYMEKKNKGERLNFNVGEWQKHKGDYNLYDDFELTKSYMYSKSKYIYMDDCVIEQDFSLKKIPVVKKQKEEGGISGQISGISFGVGMAILAFVGARYYKRMRRNDNDILLS